MESEKYSVMKVDHSLWPQNIQYPQINIAPQVNQPYVNEITLTGQNPHLKCC